MRDKYKSPLNSRYASNEMSFLFSEEKKFITWRKLWLALARCEKDLGLDITDTMINELESNVENINYEVAEEREKIVRHDVMSHVFAYGEQCPEAKRIIHLGATSCYVGDNTDLIIMKEALQLIERKLLSVVANLSEFAQRHKSTPTLGFTHYQPAQLTTVGKRATLWINDLLLDYDKLVYTINSMKLRGVKGTTGTQASFLNLFQGDHEKVKKLDKKVCQEMGFSNYYPVTGQTYSRKIDSQVLNLLSEIAQSAYKFSNDLRLLQSMKEIEEPFGKNQIGSSAMAYKRNPMRSERMGSLCRYIIVDALNPAITASTQWFERTLDDSANKRIAIAEAFLALDAVLELYINITSGMVVYEHVINAHVMSELPFMATENIIMECVGRGGDRQDLHEIIRVHSMEAAKQVKQFGHDNDLINRLVDDKKITLSESEILALLEPKNFIGRSVQQVDDFIQGEVITLLNRNKDKLLSTAGKITL